MQLVDATAMSSDSCWQVGKTLAETNRRMLQTKLGAEVSFTVPDDNGGQMRILAFPCARHLFVLIVRSTM